MNRNEDPLPLPADAKPMTRGELDSMGEHSPFEDDNVDEFLASIGRGPLVENCPTCGGAGYVRKDAPTDQ